MHGYLTLFERDNDVSSSYCSAKIDCYVTSTQMPVNLPQYHLLMHCRLFRTEISQRIIGHPRRV